MSAGRQTAALQGVLKCVCLCVCVVVRGVRVKGGALGSRLNPLSLSNNEVGGKSLSAQHLLRSAAPLVSPTLQKFPSQGERKKKH